MGRVGGGGILEGGDGEDGTGDDGVGEAAQEDEADNDGYADSGGDYALGPHPSALGGVPVVAVLVRGLVAAAVRVVAVARRRVVHLVRQEAAEAAAGLAVGPGGIVNM